MINAEEAYKMTDDSLQKKLKRIQNKINKKIKRQIKRGEYNLCLYFDCFPNSKSNKLLLKYYRDMGYMVNVSLERYDIYSKHYKMSISWHNLQTAKDGVE